MKGVFMKTNYQFSRTFEILLNNLVNRINEKNAEGITIDKEEAFQLVEAVIAESKEAAKKAAEDSVASKADINVLKTDINASEARLEKQIAEARTELLKWFVGTQIAMTGLLIAIPPNPLWVWNLSNSPLFITTFFFEYSHRDLIFSIIPMWIIVIFKSLWEYSPSPVKIFKSCSGVASKRIENEKVVFLHINFIFIRVWSV